MLLHVIQLYVKDRVMKYSKGSFHADNELMFCSSCSIVSVTNYLFPSMYRRLIIVPTLYMCKIMVFRVALIKSRFLPLKPSKTALKKLNNWHNL